MRAECVWTTIRLISEAMLASTADYHPSGRANLGVRACASGGSALVRSAPHRYA